MLYVRGCRVEAPTCLLILGRRGEGTTTIWDITLSGKGRARSRIEQEDLLRLLAKWCTPQARGLAHHVIGPAPGWAVLFLQGALQATWPWVESMVIQVMQERWAAIIQSSTDVEDFFFISVSTPYSQGFMEVKHKSFFSFL